MGEPVEERRSHARIPLDSDVLIELEGERSFVRATNISAGGLKITLSRAEMPSVQPGTIVRVRLDLGSDRYGRPLDVDCAAEIVRVDLGGPERPPGFALMWASEDAEVARQLALILEYLYGDG